MIYWTTSEAVLGTIKELLRFGACTAPRGKQTYELVNYQFSVDEPSADPIVSKDPEHNAVMAKYLKDEVDLFNACENQACAFAARAKLWDAVKNPDGTVNSAYGYIINRIQSAREKFYGPCRSMTQWEWAKQALCSDRDSRQAFVRISHPEHQWVGVRDLPCTMHLQFHIREDRLYLTTVMRSNDVTRGLPYDMPYFCLLQKHMQCELQDMYPGLRLGTYTHFAHSMHLYHSERTKALKMIGEG